MSFARQNDNIALFSDLRNKKKTSSYTAPVIKNSKRICYNIECDYTMAAARENKKNTAFFRLLSL